MPSALTGSLQAARKYSLMRPWSRCPGTITPPSGIGWASGDSDAGRGEDRFEVGAKLRVAVVDHDFDRDLATSTASVALHVGLAALSLKRSRGVRGGPAPYSDRGRFVPLVAM